MEEFDELLFVFLVFEFPDMEHLLTLTLLYLNKMLKGGNCNSLKAKLVV
jgi:hypothetical protein